MAYADLREYLKTLEDRNLLHHVAVEVDKDWEISGICRRVFQRIPPRERKALMFDRVKGFDVPLVAGFVGASREIYALALSATVDGIEERWEKALSEPIGPRVVQTGPVKEQIRRGEDADVTRIPVPTWTVGEDPAPFMTASSVVTRDPETGLSNIGCYRAQIMGPRRVGVCSGPGHHGLAHIEQHAKRGEPCPAAIVLGGDPTIGLVSVTNVPATMEEIAVAGGLRVEPVPVVRCETVDLLVPATAEYVIEGYIPTDSNLMEGPFGEYTGYLGPAAPNYYLDITCITHRTNPIYPAYFSQMPPSESSLIRQVGREMPIYHHLKHVLGLPVTAVCLPESGAAAAWLVIGMRKEHDRQPEQAIRGAWEADPSLSKFAVVVDDDVDVRDDFMVTWAISFRCQPHRDVFIQRDITSVRLDPSLEAFAGPVSGRYRVLGSKMGIDATMKHAYPAKALPPPEHLALVDERWRDYGF